MLRFVDSAPFFRTFVALSVMRWRCLCGAWRYFWISTQQVYIQVIFHPFVQYWFGSGPRPLSCLYSLFSTLYFSNKHDIRLVVRYILFNLFNWTVWVLPGAVNRGSKIKRKHKLTSALLERWMVRQFNFECLCGPGICSPPTSAQQNDEVHEGPTLSRYTQCRPFL